VPAPTRQQSNKRAQSKSDTQDLDVSPSNTVSVKVSSNIGTSNKVNSPKASLRIDPRTPTSKSRPSLSPAQSRSDNIRVLTAGNSPTDFESAVVSASVSVSSTDKHAKTPGDTRREKLTRKGTVEDIDPETRR
jgi:hypothetical protein